MDERPPMTDAALDREIQAALDVAPSPEFVARVRQRLEREPASPVWWRGRELAVAAGGILLAVVLWAGRPDVSDPARVLAPRAVATPPATAIEPARGEAAVSAEHRTPAAVSRPVAVRAAPASEDDDPFDHVLIAENERRALQWFGMATRIEPPEPSEISVSAERAEQARPALPPVSFDAPDLERPLFESVRLE
jgi:hypothetical protein